MSERLQIINDALSATGNSGLNFEFDGSEEWRVADTAFRRAVGQLLTRHNWNFATTTAPLAGGVDNPSQIFSNAYALPVDALSVETAFVNGKPLSRYEIVDNRLCCDEAKGVVVKYVRMPSDGQWPQDFREMVTMKVEEFILRGLNEDFEEARGRARDVEMMLGEIRTRTDKQAPGKAVFRSRTRARRLNGGRRLNRFEREGSA